MTDITISEALILSVVGILTVFAVLVVLMIIITIMSKIIVSLDKPKADTPAPVAEEVPNITGTPAPGSCGSLKLVNVSDSEAAMIMAIVADELKTPLNELRFKSIAAIDEN